MANLKTKLSAAMLALIAAGASAPVLMDQFLNEKEGNSLTAYRDGSGIWTICRGATRVDGKPVTQGMKLTQAKCDQVMPSSAIRRWHGLIRMCGFIYASSKGRNCQFLPL